MLINRRNGLMAGGGWKNPYITDGLVAMWDGEWNAGPGKHDANATVWVDLAGQFGDMEFGASNATPIWHDKAWEGAGVRYHGWIRSSQLTTPLEETTREVCFDDSSASLTSSYRHFTNADPYSPAAFFMFFAPPSSYYSSYTNGATTIRRSSAMPCPFRGTMYSAQRASNVNYPFINNRWAIGTNIDGSYPALKGVLFHCVRLYSRILTADEIAANYAVDKARFNLPDAS